jgi:hypothetical protein
MFEDDLDHGRKDATKIVAGKKGRAFCHENQDE